MEALCFDTFGEPEVLSLRTIPDPVPGPGEALVRTHAIGLNFADVYRREGHYHLAGSPPYVCGYEGAGEVVMLGPGTTGVSVGDRVGFTDVPFANATLVKAEVDKLIPLPESVSYELASAILLQGLTAQYLVRDSHPLVAGEKAVIHAAAGGVGSLLTQIVKKHGASAFAVVSSKEKAAHAKALGADEAVTYADDWPALAKAWGANVVFDSVGKTLLQSLSAVGVHGHVVYYGKAGGEPPDIPAMQLMDGSKRVTGGDLWNELGNRENRIKRAYELFSWDLRVDIAGKFALKDGAKAHQLIQSRTTMGKIILIP